MKPRVSFYIVKHRENLWNTGKTQGKHREFDLGKNVATLIKDKMFYGHIICYIKTKIN